MYAAFNKSLNLEKHSCQEKAAKNKIKVAAILAKL